MADYISREAVLDMAYWHGGKADVDHLYPDGVDAVDVSDIEKIPAADVEPVRHGEWLLRHIGAGHYWECSVCHTNPCIYVTEHTKFCPNCGAKMDLEEHENGN